MAKDEQERKQIALSALRPGLKDAVVDIPVSSTEFLSCRFITLGYIAANLIDNAVIGMLAARRKAILTAYTDGTQANQTKESLDSLFELINSNSDNELRQMCQNADRLRLDEKKEESGNITFVMREAKDYGEWSREQLLERIKKEMAAEPLLALELPVWGNYMPDWYGLTDEEVNKLTPQERQLRRRQAMDVEQSRRRDQMMELPMDRLYARLDQAAAQSDANEEVNRQINAVRLWAVARSPENRDEHFFIVPEVSTLAEALKRPKHVHTELMKLLQGDEILFGTFLQAYTKYNQELELTGTQLDEAVKEPFRAELPTPVDEVESGGTAGTDGGGPGLPSEVPAPSLTLAEC